MSVNETENQRRLNVEPASVVHDQWTFYLTEGVILLVLGLLAILVPPIATISVTIVIGAVFFASGVAGLVSTFSGRRAPGFWWSLISAVLGIVVGILLLVRPIAGAVSLTLVLIAFLSPRAFSRSCSAQRSGDTYRPGAGWSQAASSILHLQAFF